MSKKQGVASRLCVVLGGIGLVVGVWLPRASAAPPAPPFTNANYDNRYECRVTTRNNTWTGHMRLLPNGSGGYSKGTLTASGLAGPAGFFDPTKSPPSNFCAYDLETGQSFFTLNDKGIGTEILSWVAAATNNAACEPDFVMNNAIIVQQSSLTSENVVTRVLTTSGNLFNLGLAGNGECFK